MAVPGIIEPAIGGDVYEGKEQIWNAPTLPPKRVNGDELLRRGQLEADSFELLNCFSREDVLTSLAKIEQRKLKRREFEDAGRRIDQQLDHATAQHQASTAPIQAKLSELDAKILKALVAKKSTADHDVERRQLNHQLEELNAGLELASKEAESRRRILERELSSPSLNVKDEQPLKNKLIEFGTPKQMAELRGIEEVITRIEQYVAPHFRGRAEDFQYRATNEGGSDWPTRARRAGAAVSIVSQIIIDLRAQQAEVRQQIIQGE